MSCPEFEELLGPYLDGELSEQEELSVLTHLQQCPECAAREQEMRGLVEALRQLDEVEVPEDFHSHLHEQLLQQPAPERPSSFVSGRWMRPLGFCAAAVAVVAVGLTLATAMLPVQLSANSAGGSPYSYAAAEGGYDNAAGGANKAPEAEPSENGADMAAPESADPGGGLTAGQAQGGASVLTEGRKLTYRTEMTLETDDFDSQFAALQALVAQCGGYVESSSQSGLSFEQAGGYGRTATMVCRIPQSQYEGMVTGVANMGRLLRKNDEVNDITDSYTDTELRISTLKNQLSTLQDLLAKAESVEDVTTLVSEINAVTYELESLESALRNYDRQVDYSVVSVELQEVKSLSQELNPAQPQSLGQRIQRAFYQGLNALREGSASLLVGLIAALPTLLVVAAVLLVVAFAVLAIIRAVLKRKKS